MDPVTKGSGSMVPRGQKGPDPGQRQSNTVHLRPIQRPGPYPTGPGSIQHLLLDALGRALATGREQPKIRERGGRMSSVPYTGPEGIRAIEPRALFLPARPCSAVLQRVASPCCRCRHVPGEQRYEGRSPQGQLLPGYPPTLPLYYTVRYNTVRYNTVRYTVRYNE